MVVKEIIDMIKNIALGVIFALLIIRFIGGTASISQYSMQTTLYENDYVWVEKLTPFFRNVHRGDIITIYAPDIGKDAQFTLVKRVVAIENDYVEIKDGKVFVNGAAIKEDYTKGDYTESPTEEFKKYNSFYIKPGKVYALGDNRSKEIYDSRNMGQIDIKDIRGRVVFRFYPNPKQLVYSN